MSTEGLEALEKSLLKDDPRLIQGGSTLPSPIYHWCGVTAACPVTLCGVADLGGFAQDDQPLPGNATVAEAGDFFASACYKADQLLGEPAGCRYFLNYWDSTDRPEAIQELLKEVALELERRATTATDLGE